LSVREGEAGSRERSEANVGRGKAELFPLQGARRGKSGVFSESTVLSFLKQSSGPTLSDSLEEKHRCGETMFGGSKGVCPFGRRAGVMALPEKGRQRAVSGERRTLEGGKRSCSPSKKIR